MGLVLVFLTILRLVEGLSSLFELVLEIRKHVLESEVEVSKVDINLITRLNFKLFVRIFGSINETSVDDSSIWQVLEDLHLLFEKGLNLL